MNISNAMSYPDPVVKGVCPVEVVGEPVVRQAVHFRRRSMVDYLDTERPVQGELDEIPVRIRIRISLFREQNPYYKCKRTIRKNRL